jgi:hypothetical protein
MKKIVSYFNKAGVLTITSLFLIIAVVPIGSAENVTNDNNGPVNVLKNNQPVLTAGQIQQRQSDVYKKEEMWMVLETSVPKLRAFRDA